VSQSRHEISLQRVVTGVTTEGGHFSVGGCVVRDRTRHGRRPQQRGDHLAYVIVDASSFI